MCLFTFFLFKTTWQTGHFLFSTGVTRTLWICPLGPAGTVVAAGTGNVVAVGVGRLVVTVAEMIVAAGVELVVVVDGAGMLVATGVGRLVVAGAGMVGVTVAEMTVAGGGDCWSWGSCSYGRGVLIAKRQMINKFLFTQNC